MDVVRSGDTLSYRSRRRWPSPAGVGQAPCSRIGVRVGERLADPDPLARFLTARWGLHRPGSRGPVYWPNEHPEWPLHRAELLDLAESQLAAAGQPGVTGAPDSVLFSPGVDVRVGPSARCVEFPGDGFRPRGTPLRRGRGRRVRWRPGRRRPAHP
jgi:uncharacterized protein YqjF (DUF2071 family)